ncbi:MAG: hypothetical protein HC867_01525 [Bacteroidia bacterium]|nr:hypothetical protein [Bacteroidia bacterium]
MTAVTKITDSVVIYVVIDTTSNQTGIDTILVSDIEKIKLKRNAVEYGMLTGAAVGGLAGYGAGYISYSDDASVSDEDNQDYRDGRAIAGAIIGSVPGTLIGAIIGGVFTKRVLKINGNPENILRLVNLLNRKRPFN